MYENERKNSLKTMIGLADSFLNICSNVVKELESEVPGLFKKYKSTADLNSLKFNALVSSITKLLKTTDSLDNYLSNRVPGLSIKLLNSKQMILTTVSKMVECLNEDQSVVTNYIYYEKLASDLKQNLIDFNEIFFEAQERATEIYNRSN